MELEILRDPAPTLHGKLLDPWDDAQIVGH